MTIGDYNKKFEENIKKRLDSELEQAAIRIIFSIAIIIYFNTQFHKSIVGDSHTLELLNYFSYSFAVFSVLIYIFAFISNKISPIRRILGIIIDVTHTSAALIVTDQEMLLVIIMYPWVIIGNAMRFGLLYMKIATIASITAFIVVVILNPYWNNKLVATLTIIVSILVMAYYLGILLKRLNTALSFANEADKNKSRFIAHMSHELRTPLNGVIGLSHLLKDTNPTPEQDDLINVIDSSAHTVLELVDNILDLSKINAKMTIIEKSDFNIRKLLNEVLATFDYQIKQKSLNLSLHVDPEIPILVTGDSLHIKQVLLNIISNAIKFTDTGGIDIRLTCKAINNQSVTTRFEISDTGIGIPLEAQAKIFESFQQADESTYRKYGGTGLGMTISKDLVSLMGGDLGLRSKPGEGTTFFFTLTLTISETHHHITIDPSLNNGTILVTNFEDSRDIINVLDKWNIKYVECDSSARVLSLLVDNDKSTYPVTTIIIGRSNFDIDLNTFSSVIKNDSELKNILLITYEKKSEKSIDEMYYQAGIDIVLHSPIEERLLLNALHSSRFTINDKLRSTAPGEIQLNANNTNKLKILIADDDSVNRRLLEKILTNLGHCVTIAKDGEEVIDLVLLGITFDLLILDFNLPKYTGSDVLNALSYMSSTNQIPAFILTADTTLETKNLCLEAGAVKVLTKPIMQEAIKTAISEIDVDIIRTDFNEPANDNILSLSSTNQQDSIINHTKLDTLRENLTDPASFYQIVIRFLNSCEQHMYEMRLHSSHDDTHNFIIKVEELNKDASNIGAKLIDSITRNIIDIASKDEAGIQIQMNEYLETLENALKQTHDEYYHYMRHH